MKRFTWVFLRKWYKLGDWLSPEEAASLALEVDASGYGWSYVSRNNKGRGTKTRWDAVVQWDGKGNVSARKARPRSGMIQIEGRTNATP